MKDLFIEGLIQLSPLWSLSLLAFIPLTAKMLRQNRELRSGLTVFLYGGAIFSSLLLFFLVGFKETEILLLQFSPYTTGACILTGGAGFLSLLFFLWNPFIDRKQLTEILFLFCQGLNGLYVFCLAGDLMTAFVGLELASLMIYMNLAMSRRGKPCLEAAVKYFVLSALSGTVFLYGLSFLFGAGGTLEIKALFENSAIFYHRFFFLGFALVFCGLFFKVALFPFHFWLADVYEGAESPMTVFMATAVKTALILFIGRLFGLSFSSSFSSSFFEKAAHGEIFLQGLALAGVLTSVFGNLMALRQVRLKRFAGFSSLSHSGYLMMAIYGISRLPDPLKDFSVIFYYLLAYIFLTGGLFWGIQLLERCQPSRPIQLSDLGSLFKKQPLFASLFAICLLGLAGIPPSFGFFAKLGLFQPLLLSKSWAILFWIFLLSAIGLYYYMKVFICMLREEGNGGSPAAVSGSAAGSVSASVPVSPSSDSKFPDSKSPDFKFPDFKFPRGAMPIFAALGLFGLLGGWIFGNFF